jgi:hypothetical protein
VCGNCSINISFLCTSEFLPILSPVVCLKDASLSNKFNCFIRNMEQGCWLFDLNNVLANECYVERWGSMEIRGRGRGRERP